MAKKNFDAFINAAGKKPKPTPEEVEAMAKQLHTVGAPLAVAPETAAQNAVAPIPVTTAPTPPPVAKVAKAVAPPVAKQKAVSAKAPASRQSEEAPKEKVRITIDLAKDLYKRMKLAVVQNETEISAYVRQLIEEDLNQKKG